MHPFDDRDVLREELSRADDPDDPAGDRRGRRRRRSHDDTGVTVTGPAVRGQPRSSSPAGCSSRSRGSTSTGTTTRPRRSRPAPPPCWAPRPVGAARRRRRRPARRARRAWPRHVRRPAAGPPASSALTGSQGKTSTKDLLAQVLATAGPTVATAGSFNNELGMPLTVLRADAAPGSWCSRWAPAASGTSATCAGSRRRRSALVLNVGTAHVGEFGSQEAIAQAKGELVEALAADGTAVLNADDPLVLAMAGAHRGPVRDLRRVRRRRRPGRRPGPRRRSAGPQFDLVHAPTARARRRCGCVGEHQAGNAAAAAAVALALGMPLDDVAAALLGADQRLALADGAARARRRRHRRQRRLQRQPRLDAGRAQGAGRHRPRRGPGARTVAVLGEMRELGESSRDEHDAFGRLAVRLDISPARGGRRAGAGRSTSGACLEGSWGEESVFVADNDAGGGVAARARSAPGTSSWSRHPAQPALEQVAEALLADDPGQDPGPKESPR